MGMHLVGTDVLLFTVKEGMIVDLCTLYVVYHMQQSLVYEGCFKVKLHVSPPELRYS